jgi:hypothetical protein
VSFTCADLDAALRSEASDRLDVAAAHASQCPRCDQALRLWREISEAAPGLRRDWDSPQLWPRIERTLTTAARVEPVARPPRLRPGVFLAVAAALVVAVAGTWLFLRSLEPPGATLARQEIERQLLTEDALAAVERAEADHVHALEALSRLAAPRVAAPGSPLMMSYREKLTLLDAAIAECRTQVERNRYNAHLRRELLDIYGEKQRTLKQILEEEKNAL